MNAVLKPAVHPLAGKTMTGAEIVVQLLADEGTGAVFGYSGGAILPTYDAIFRFNRENRADNGAEKMPLIVPANEQAAGFMAAGYARASGKVGVCLVTSGPGATNTVTPVRDCMADSIPIVVLCGQVPTHAVGTDAFQEAPISTIMGSAAKHVFLVTDPSKLEATVRTAFEIARTGRPGPVVVDIPKDVQNWSGTFKGEGVLPIPGYRARLKQVYDNRLSTEQVAKLHEMLKASKRPLIYAGGGVIHGEASASLRSFAKAFGIPVTTTLMGIGAYDTTDPLALEMLGMHGTAFANYATDDCDFLIAVGARFDDRVAGVPSKFAPSAKGIAHFDIDPSEINKVKRVSWHHVGELNNALGRVEAYLNEQGFRPDYSAWHAHIAELKQKHPMNYERGGDHIQPHAVIEEINKITQGEAIVATGVGQHQMWAAQYFDFKHPRLWLTSGSMGTMGFGLPAALGAQFACPDKIVIDIDGDASIRMNLGELETATTYSAPVKVVVLNNFGDGMVKQWQRLFFDSRYAGSDKSLHQKDFIKAAEADGYRFAVRVSSKADLPRVVKDFIEFKGPAFLEVIIDPMASVYPMVGPGMSYEQMITGDWIASRSAAPVSDDVKNTQMF
ncbi:biosynthetic-type acetolactate synthase large subunit [Solimonas sp. K1W22B-7]|uniref:biosynthetic-type acetolactate synthase large subunit n=1 Tax=Solimonas sp. K1W22B-7 TaxID=2303331 RepID=UPI000E334B6D|nr:biosynthetic-type acetolactate synthase large subunit [Solimonas sp. K1W22B-7]AXQ29720.1 biosynthetic-type acetolactate synthase large subunit [Solimonas sp. K1W22B-7]